MKIYIAALAFILAQLPVSAIYAQDEKPIMRKKPAQVLIGDRWMTGRKRYMATDVQIYSIRDLDSYELMRRPAVDEKRSTYRSTPFPLSTLEEMRPTLEVLVTISAQGKVTECRFYPDTPPDPDISPDINLELVAKDHACPMLQNNVRFIAALNDKGEPTETQGKLNISYEVSSSYIGPANPPPIFAVSPGEASKARPARSVEQITLETVGLTNQIMKELGKTSVTAFLRIDKNGKATGCSLTAATDDDTLDRQICAKAIMLDYIPGVDENLNVKDDYFILYVSADDPVM
jgi:hypothetical protein